jgi:hypothetical protein
MVFLYQSIPGMKLMEDLRAEQGAELADKQEEFAVSTKADS